MIFPYSADHRNRILKSIWGWGVLPQNTVLYTRVSKPDVMTFVRRQETRMPGRVISASPLPLC